jgi:multiple sugar transport system permease protein
MIASIYLSLTSYDLYTPPTWVGLANFTQLFKDPLFRQAMKVTSTYAIISVPLHNALAIAVAILLNQKVRGLGFYRTAYYMPSIVSGVSVALIWSWLFNSDFGLLNSFLAGIGLPAVPWLTSPEWVMPAFIFMSLWTLGGTMIIYLAALQGIPEQLYDAAAVDGANWWAQFRHVTIPMLTPAIFFNLVLGVIGAFQVFTNALVMTNGGPANATLFYILYLYRQAFQWFEMGYAAALAWVLFVVLMALTLVQLRMARHWVYYEGRPRR